MRKEKISRVQTIEGQQQLRIMVSSQSRSVTQESAASSMRSETSVAPMDVDEEKAEELKETDGAREEDSDGDVPVGDAPVAEQPTKIQYSEDEFVSSQRELRIVVSVCVHSQRRLDSMVVFLRGEHLCGRDRVNPSAFVGHPIQVVMESQEHMPDRWQALNERAFEPVKDSDIQFLAKLSSRPFDLQRVSLAPPPPDHGGDSSATEMSNNGGRATEDSDGTENQASGFVETLCPPPRISTVNPSSDPVWLSDLMDGESAEVKKVGLARLVYEDSHLLRVRGSIDAGEDGASHTQAAKALIRELKQVVFSLTHQMVGDYTSVNKKIIAGDAECIRLGRLNLVCEATHSALTLGLLPAVMEVASQVYDWCPDTDVIVIVPPVDDDSWSASSEQKGEEVQENVCRMSASFAHVTATDCATENAHAVARSALAHRTWHAFGRGEH